MKVTALYIKLKALVTSSKLEANVQYVLLQVLAITGKFVDLIEANDTISETDAKTMAITKQLTDITDLLEQISLGASKSFADSTAFSDLVVVATAFNRTFADTTSFSDAAARDVSKLLADSLTSADTATAAVTKLIADSLSMVDSVVGINVVDAENDALAIDDLGVDDDPAIDIFKNLSDAASTTDAGLLIMQNYCDITYFAEDYVGLSRAF